MITLKLNDFLLELKEKHYKFVDNNNIISINNISFPCTLINNQIVSHCERRTRLLGSKLIIDISGYIYNSETISFLLKHYKVLIKINNKNYRFYTDITIYNDCRKNECIYAKVKLIEL